MRELVSESEIREAVSRLAAEIQATYGSTPLTIVGIMTGSIVLLADLIRQLSLPLRVGVVQASSYRGETSRGQLTVNADLMLDIDHHDVLLVDDIFDTGWTLSELVRKMRAFEPTSIRTAVLLRKVGRQEVEFHPDFVGFEIPDEFVVGYGLDYRDAYRNLPFIAALDPEDLTRSLDQP